MAFSTETECDEELKETLEHIKVGLSVALTQFPEFAATIAPKRVSTRRELELKICPQAAVRFRVMYHTIRDEHDGNWPDCEDGLQDASYEDFVQGNFPLTKLAKERFFIPHAEPDDQCPEELPVTQIQANVIQGGILIGFSWHHSVSDARGVNTFVHSWAEATARCSGFERPDDTQTLSPEMRHLERLRLSYGILGASIDEYPDYVEDASIRSLGRDRSRVLDRNYATPSDSRLSMWQFKRESIQSLMAEVNNADERVNGKPFAQFTAVEALSALLWMQLSKARQLNTIFPGGTSLFTTRIDFRRRLSPPLAGEYVGNVNQPIPRARVSISELCESKSNGISIRRLAHRIRDAIEKSDDRSVRRLIGYVERLPSVTDLALKFDTGPGPDMAITDLSGLNIMTKDWGDRLGYITHLRVFVRYRGFVALLPHQADGSIPTLLQCEAAAVEKLKADPFFTQFATYLY